MPSGHQSFSTSEELIQHDLSSASNFDMSDRDDERPYKCSLCPKAFREPKHRRRHERRHERRAKELHKFEALKQRKMMPHDGAETELGNEAPRMPRRPRKTQEQIQDVSEGLSSDGLEVINKSTKANCSLSCTEESNQDIHGVAKSDDEADTTSNLLENSVSVESENVGLNGEDDALDLSIDRSILSTSTESDAGAHTSPIMSTSHIEEDGEDDFPESLKDVDVHVLEAPATSFTTDSDKPYSCNLCSAAYKSKYSLKRHQNRHVGIMPSKCRFCQETFNRARIRDSHELALHGSTM